ncbi:hypothetical protein A9978_09100 [Pseudomonas sp. UMC65]|nr:hypothetical protein [Pseudomonas sp. UMC65]MBB1622846.1 hypothetical protein [Pseudomonas sp. UME65]
MTARKLPKPGKKAANHRAEILPMTARKRLKQDAKAVNTAMAAAGNRNLSALTEGGLAALSGSFRRVHYSGVTG